MFSFLGNSPLLKAIVSNVAGAAAVTVDAAIQGGPTGGAGAYLAAHPQIIPIYVLAAQFIHNLLSKYAPPQTASK